MRPKTLARRLIPGLLFGFVVFLGLSIVGDLRQVGAQVLGFRWGYFPAVIALTLFNYTLRWVKFHYYLGQVGLRSFPRRQSLRLFVAGFPLAMTPGKVGEMLKGVWIEQKTGLPAARGVAVVLAERISDGLAVLLLSLAGVIAYPSYWPAFAAILGILLGVIVISQLPPLANFFLMVGERLPLLGGIMVHLRNFYEGSYSLFRPLSTMIAIGLGAVSWLGEGIGMYLILLGLGVEGGWLSLSIAVFTLSFSTVVGGVSALPGGLGAAEASIAGMLVLLLGLASETAAAATLLIRFATLWFGVSLGLVTWLFSPDLLRMSEVK